MKFGGFFVCLRIFLVIGKIERVFALFILFFIL